MLPLISRAKNSFILKINKSLYKSDVIAKAMEENKAWITKFPSQDQYACFELKTKDIEKVLEWSNYLIYLNKTV